LLKDNNYEECDKLKSYLKRYINLKNEIDILENTLNDLDNTPEMTCMHVKLLNKELEIYFKLLDKLNNQLNLMNKKINISNYDELTEYLEKLRNVIINDSDNSLKWDICNRISELKAELENIEWELELMILNYGLQRFEIDDNPWQTGSDIFGYLCEKIVEYLNNKQQ
jgi:protein subunit release factor A